MNNAFELISSLQIFLSADALEPLQLAVQDLMQDIQKATGGTVTPTIVHTMPSYDGIVVRILPEVFPNEAVENYHLHSEADNLLFIDGSARIFCISIHVIFGRRFLSDGLNLSVGKILNSKRAIPLSVIVACSSMMKIF